MRRFLTAFAAILPTLLPASGASADQTPAPPAKCKMAVSAELTIRFEHDRPLIAAELNGHKGWFLVDTGAGATLLFGDTAAAFKLPAGIDNGLSFHGVGGARAGKVAKVDALTVGRTTVKGASFFVLDDSSGSTKTPEVFGLLGRDVLSAPEIELDFPHKTVRPLKAENCADDDMPYWATRYSEVEIRTPPEASASEIWVPVSVNDHPIIAELDSGAQVTTVTPGAAQSAGAKLSEAASQGGGLGPSAVAFRVAEFKSLQLGEERVAPAKLGVADMFAYNTQLGTNTLFRVTTVARPSMLLGADFLRSHRVLISYAKRRVYFSYEGGDAFQAR